MDRGVYCGYMKLHGEENGKTLLASNNYAWGLLKLRRFEEGKALLRQTLPVARRVLNEGNDLLLVMRWAYARALYQDTGATLDDLREAVRTLEDADQIGRRVLGGTHPDVMGIADDLRLVQGLARAVLRTRETQPPS